MMNTKINKPVAVKSDLLNQILAKSDPLQSHRTKTRMFVAARIIEAMRAQGISKKILAEKCNRSPASVTKWLSGTQNLTLDTLAELEYILQIPLLQTDDIEPKINITVDIRPKPSAIKVASEKVLEMTH